MATYAEFLKSSGATDEEIKLLDTPVAQKAYARLEAAVVEKEAARVKAESRTAAYQEWYETKALPYTTDIESKLKVAEADLIGERARLKSLQDAGLIEVAAEDEAKRKAAEEAAKRGEVTFDLAKFVPREQFNELALKSVDAITLVSDLSTEHAALGLPPVSWRALKNEAAAANQDLESFWKTKFNVDAKRSERAAAEKSAYEKQVGEQAVAKWKQEHPASTVNPALGFGVPSTTPFTGRVPSATDAKQPWQVSDSQRVNSRINKVLSAHPDIAGNA